MTIHRILSLFLFLLAGLPLLTAQTVGKIIYNPISGGPAPGTGFSAVGAICSANEVNSDTSCRLCRDCAYIYAAFEQVPE